MPVHLINPSDYSFESAVITARWLFVLAAATPRSMGDPILVDDSIGEINPNTIHPSDVVGISIHTGNALRGYQVGKLARYRGATVVYGGIHATLFPEEPFERGSADAVVKGDGDIAWAELLHNLEAGCAKRIYEGGKIDGNEFLAARWDPMQTDKSFGHRSRQSGAAQNTAPLFCLEIASTLATILRLSRFEVDSFTVPIEALKAAEVGHPHLLISDVMMRGLSGVELATLMRATCPDCKILLFQDKLPRAIFWKTLVVKATISHSFRSQSIRKIS